MRRIIRVDATDVKRARKIRPFLEGKDVGGLERRLTQEGFTRDEIVVDISRLFNTPTFRSKQGWRYSSRKEFLDRLNLPKDITLGVSFITEDAWYREMLGLSFRERRIKNLGIDKIKQFLAAVKPDYATNFCYTYLCFEENDEEYLPAIIKSAEAIGGHCRLAGFVNGLERGEYEELNKTYKKIDRGFIPVSHLRNISLFPDTRHLLDPVLELMKDLYKRKDALIFGLPKKYFVDLPSQWSLVSSVWQYYPGISWRGVRGKEGRIKHALDALTKKEVEGIYDCILTGTAKKPYKAYLQEGARGGKRVLGFPMYFLQKTPKASERAAIVTRYLVKKLGLKEENIPAAINKKTFIRNRLYGLLQAFNGSVYAVIENAYPSRFNPWEFTYRGMWQGEEGRELARKATRWMVREKLSPRDGHKGPVKVRVADFKEHGLGGMLVVLYDNKPARALKDASAGLK